MNPPVESLHSIGKDSKRYNERILPVCGSAVLLVSTLLLLFPCHESFAIPFHSSYPEEPERYDSEYYLDMLTMRFDRDWRDLWYSKDNAFILSFGSLNVEQWNLNESLKFSTQLSRRLRVRYWMERHHSLDEWMGERSEIELELRLYRKFYLSFLVAPAFWKRENDIGVCFQRRRAIDRYIKLLVRVHDFANNFAYKHGDNIEGEENLFKKQPVEGVLDAREEIGSRLRMGFLGSVTNRWEKAYRFIDNHEDDYNETRSGMDVSFWLEYDVFSSWRLDLDVVTSAFLLDRTGSGALGERHRIRELLPRIWWYPGMAPENGGGAGLSYTATDCAGRAGGIYNNYRVALCAGIKFRRERWTGHGTETGDFRKDEFLPFLLVQKRLSRSHMIELGYLSDRYSSRREGFYEGTDKRWENRLKLAWGMRLRGESQLRIIETVDLDREDWGQFSVHDHFFIMMLLAF